MRGFSLLLLALLLTACSRTEPEALPTAAENATFVVNQITGSVAEGSSSGAFANIASSRFVHFSACLKDVAVLEPVTNASFALFDGAQSLPLLDSEPDPSGCLHWSETIPYNSTEPETFLSLERKITATRTHRGSVTISLAVNPWKKGAEGLRDLRFQEAPKNFGAGAAAAKRASGLVIESVQADLEIVRSEDAVANALLRLQFQPKVRRVGLDGEILLENLTSGALLLRVQLVAVYAGEIIPLTDVAEIPNLRFSQGPAAAESRLRILRKIPKEATIEMSLEAVPIQAGGGLASAKGRVSLGRLTSLSLSRNSPLRPEQEMSFLAPPEKSGAPFAFRVGRVRAAEAVVKEVDGTGRPKLLELSMVACLWNSISEERILGQEFALSLEPFQETKATDEEEGCLRWKQLIPFDFHAKEIPQRKELRLISANRFYGSQAVKRVIHLNPWRYETPANIVIDEEFDGPPSAAAPESQHASELVLSSIFFNLKERSFSIDPRLNLSVLRTYTFEIQPKIRRFSRNQGWLPAGGTGNGRYRLRFLLETLNADNPKVIDAQEIEAESRADVISASVTFRIDDLRLVSSRARLSLEVLPLDRASSLSSQPYAGAFDMLGGFSVRLEPRPGLFSRRFRSASRKPEPAAGGSALFAKARGHRMLDEAKLATIKLAPESIDKIVASGGAAPKELCSLFYEEGGFFSHHRGCQRKPDGYLVLQPTEHVTRIHRSRAQAPDTSTLSTFAGIMLTQYESEDESRSRTTTHNFESGVKVSVPVLNLLGLDIGFGGGANDSWSQSRSHTRGKSTGTARGSDESRSMTVDQVAFQLDADVERCLLITTREGEKGRPVYMRCTQPKRRSVQEAYYLVYQPIAASGILDPGASLDSRPMVFFVRGKARFQNFVKLLQDPQVTLHFDRGLAVPRQVMQEAEGRYDGFFPGMLTPRE